MHSAPPPTPHADGFTVLEFLGAGPSWQTWRARTKTGRGPAASKAPVRLLHLLHMFDVLNSCGIDRLVPWDDAHDPVYRDKALQERYAQARLDASQPRE